MTGDYGVFQMCCPEQEQKACRDAFFMFFFSELDESHLLVVILQCTIGLVIYSAEYPVGPGALPSEILTALPSVTTAIIDGFEPLGIAGEGTSSEPGWHLGRNMFKLAW